MAATNNNWWRLNIFLNLNKLFLTDLLSHTAHAQPLLDCLVLTKITTTDPIDDEIEVI